MVLGTLNVRANAKRSKLPRTGSQPRDLNFVIDLAEENKAGNPLSILQLHICSKCCEREYVE